MNKNGFSRCADIDIGRLREEGRSFDSARLSERPSLLLASFVVSIVCLSVKSPVERLRRYEQHLYAMWSEAQYDFHVYAYASEYLQSGCGGGQRSLCPPPVS